MSVVNVEPEFATRLITSAFAAKSATGTSKFKGAATAAAVEGGGCWLL